MEKTLSYNIKNVENALEIFNLFIEAGSSLSAVEIQKKLGINANMAFRLLTTMVNARFLSHDPDTEKYRPSLKALQLCNMVLNSHSLRRASIAAMHAFSREYPRFNCNLAVLENDAVFSLHRFNGDAAPEYSFNPGTRLPPHASAVGKMLLAGLPDADVRRILQAEGMAARTPDTITELPAFMKHLQEVRREKLAWSRREHIPNLVGAAAPIQDAAGGTIAALSVSCFTDGEDPERLQDLIPRLRTMAYDISYALGF